MIARLPICVAASTGVSFQTAEELISSGWASRISLTRARFPCALPTSSSTIAWSISGPPPSYEIVSIAKYMLADRLHGAALHLMRGIRQADRRLGVGPARLSALSVLLAGPKTLTELAEAEQVSPATISRIAAGLIRTGLAKRVPNPTERRSARLEITPAGRRLI